VTENRELMRIQIATLFTLDRAGRLLRVNEPAGAPAPRFFLGRTAAGSEWRCRHDVPDDVVRELHAVCASETLGDEFLDPPYGAARYAEVLARTAPVKVVEAGPAYRFPAELPATSDAVLITNENRELLQPSFAAWYDDVAFCQPFMALVQQGQAVSVCASVRVTPAAHEAGVETPAPFRGRGYAARVVAAWARAVRAIGSIPLYSTSWQNTASQAVARKLGLVRYGTDLHIT
jgi:RimJ/RimL family protein N-acetyltransferase